MELIYLDPRTPLIFICTIGDGVLLINSKFIVCYAYVFVIATYMLWNEKLIYDDT